MEYRGSISANGKTATVQFMPGWGEPGAWLIKLGKDDEYSVNQLFNDKISQAEFLTHLSSEKVVKDLIEQDWRWVGNEEDVILACLEYTGYNDQNRAEDEKIIERTEGLALELKEKVREYVLVSQDLDLEKLAEISAEAVTAFKALKDSIRQLKKVTDVYDAMKAGEQVGLGWNNRSFLRNFPGHPVSRMISQVNAEKE